MFHFFNLKISFSMSKWSFKKNTIAIFIIFFGVTLRIFLNEKIGIPNFEAVTALSLLSGSFLGGIYVVVVPLLTMVFSDLYFGNTSILFFTWSAFMIIGIFGWLLRKRKSFSPRFIGKMTGIGIIASLFFYLYTNFGWWLLTNMYPKALEGLVQCYLMGLPFLRANLLGNLLFVHIFTSFALFAWKYHSVFWFKLLATSKKLINYELKS